ncbi:hypothetical protein FKM82_014030 [Ascaphus truei]
MKQKGKSVHVAQPEECGVWLDTTELKKRPLQTVLSCSTNSRFHPFLRRKPIDSVTFAFTQTEAPQPCTKQTSIYSFLAPVGKKSGMENVPCMNANTPILPHHRKPEDAHPVKSKTTEGDESLTQEQCPVTPCAPTLCEATASDCDLPCAATAECPRIAVGEGLWVCSAGSHVRVKPTDGLRYSVRGQGAPDLCNGHGDVAQEAVAGQGGSSCVVNTPDPPQTQAFSKPALHKAQEDLPGAPRSPRHSWDMAGPVNKKLCSSMVRDSPIRSSRCEEASHTEQDGLHHSVTASQLFTEDSQGNRVICHRPVSDRSRKRSTALPLQDRTNVTQERAAQPRVSQPLLCDQKMFTQDSEGNVVMKHW